MAYYTGTEVKVWIQTEHSTRGIQINSNQLEAVNNSADSSYDQAEVYGRNLVGKSGFNLPDITGVDLSTGAQDEEIAYFGTKTPGKIETKADMSVTLTRKKSDRLFSTLAQGDTASGKSRGSGGHGGRWGLVRDSPFTDADDMVISDGTIDPKSSLDESGAVSYGYRVAIQLKAASSSTDKDGAIIILRNCSMGEYTTTMSNDSANEESINFVSMVKPLILNGILDGAAFDGGNEATASADM
jgi:hypothetical protein